MVNIESKPTGQAAAGTPQKGHVPPVASSTADEPNDRPKKFEILLNIFFILYFDFVWLIIEYSILTVNYKILFKKIYN